MRRIVASHKAPKAIGPYSQGVVTHHAGGAQMLHSAGQIPIDPATGELVSGDVTAQAERVMENVAAVLEHAGMDFSDVVKTTVFLVDLGDFAAMNEVYGRRFVGDFPARSTVQVAALPKGSRIEVEVHAVKLPAHGAPVWTPEPPARAARRARPAPRAVKVTARPAAKAKAKGGRKAPPRAKKRR